MTRDGKAAAEIPNDQELVQRVQKGDTEAFGVLALRHQRSVYWVIQAILRNQADSEEIRQETVVKALQHIRDFRGEARFATWLIRIAINEARMRQRKYRPGLYESLDEDKSEQDDFRPRELSDWRPNPEQILAKEEIAELLRKAIQSLPSIYREVFLLRDVEHHSTEETATALAITVPAAKTRLLRARLMVREFLAPHFAQSRLHGSATPGSKKESADNAQPGRANL